MLVYSYKQVKVAIFEMAVLQSEGKLEQIFDLLEAQNITAQEVANILSMLEIIKQCDSPMHHAVVRYAMFYELDYGAYSPTYLLDDSLQHPAGL